MKERGGSYVNQLADLVDFERAGDDLRASELGGGALVSILQVNVRVAVQQQLHDLHVREGSRPHQRGLPELVQKEEGSGRNSGP
jgi:hypothetical protein